MPQTYSQPHGRSQPPRRRSLLGAVGALVTLGAAATGVEATTAPPSSSIPTTEAPRPADPAAFPVTVETKYGAVTVDALPERVVSIGFAEHDSLLALGVEPIAVREWYGDQPFATYPWAQDELADLEPEVLPSNELNFEQIAALDPDLIVGVNSGMTERDFATLSAIAPTIAQPGEFDDYATPWRDSLRLQGEVTGRSAQADAVIARVEDMIAAARDSHPDFAGQTAAVAFVHESLPGAYASGDPRSQLLAELGFEIPTEFDELAGDAFYFTVSQEEIATLDTDVLVWIASDATGYQAINGLTLRPTLTAVREGREVVADPTLSAAFSHGSPLSLEYVLAELVPQLELAVDGDPATAVPSLALLEGGSTTTDAKTDATTADTIETTADGDFTADERAAADAWSVVFDSNAAFDDKAAHLDDAEALRSTVEAYQTSGADMGGITLDPTGVVVHGDVATVTYDVMFGTSAAYTGLDGEITLVDGTWTVSRDEFCSFMASARNSCPS